MLVLVVAGYPRRIIQQGHYGTDPAMFSVVRTGVPTAARPLDAGSSLTQNAPGWNEIDGRPYQRQRPGCLGGATRPRRRGRELGRVRQPIHTLPVRLVRRRPWSGGG